MYMYTFMYDVTLSKTTLLIEIILKKLHTCIFYLEIIIICTLCRGLVVHGVHVYACIEFYAT